MSAADVSAHGAAAGAAGPAVSVKPVIIASTGRQFGVAVGVAVTGSIVTSTGPQFVSSSRAAWAVLAGCGILALILGLISTGQWAQGTATRNGQRLAPETGTPPRQAEQTR